MASMEDRKHIAPLKSERKYETNKLHGTILCISVENTPLKNEDD
jgi:hypothetical protein